MTAQLRSELRKLRTTRTNLGLAHGLVALILFGVLAGGFGSEASRVMSSTSATQPPVSP